MCQSLPPTQCDSQPVSSPQDCLSPLSMQALPAAPEALCIVEMGGYEGKEETGEASKQGGLFLNIGLQVGDGRVT